MAEALPQRLPQRSDGSAALHRFAHRLSVISMLVVIIALAFAAVFGFNVWQGLKTQEVRLPISILVFEEFDRRRSPSNYWGIMAFNAVISLAAIGLALCSLWSVVSYKEKPVHFVQTLDGCYEGQGLPDFMRPSRHWTMQISGGKVTGREGVIISRIYLGHVIGTRTPVHFTPSILIGGKPSTVFAGETVDGDAYSVDGTVTIALHDDWPDIMTSTSCQ